MAKWNPWHGCRKLSEGCQNCYVYRIDAMHGLNSSEVRQTSDFDLPVRRRRNGDYKMASGETVYTCLSSDFFLEEADRWRSEAWRMIGARADLHFIIITKRIARFADCLPEDWGDGYDNVTVYCTVENQKRSDERMPLFLSLPIKHRGVICEPLLGPIELHLNETVGQVIVGGESGESARCCHFEWVTDIRRQCAESGVAFHFKQTGERFMKDGRLYRIDRKDQMSQARRAAIDIPDLKNE